MRFNYITFRSVTFAQRGQGILNRAGIESTLQRTPRGLEERGCGYCLRVRAADAAEAIELLRQAQVNYGKLYAIGADGTAEERRV